MQDRPQGLAPDQEIVEQDKNEKIENPSDLTEKFPHLFSTAGRNNSARNKKACRKPRTL